MTEKIIILDFGSQTTQLIGRRLRDLGVYCEIVPYNKFPKKDTSVKGVILSGSPFSVYDAKAFQTELSSIRGTYPVLGICYGAQFIAHTSGGKIEKTDFRAYEKMNLTKVNNTNPLLNGVSEGLQVWMSQSDSITAAPENFEIIAGATAVQAAAYQVKEEKTWGVQFHPEVYLSQEGSRILDNFLSICGCRKEWSPASFVDATVSELKQQLNNDKVILALSGGVDSSVCAVLLNKAIGENLRCIFVNHGLLRKHEFENVLRDYKDFGLHVIGVDVKEKFYRALDGITEPEQKRKIIGKGFIEVFEEEARKIKDVQWLGQGTIYPDIIESLSVTGATIKSHHNVGGLPEKMRLRLVEPLRVLFKDEVRRVGLALGMKPHLIYRHPFPGPGLGIRILGAITPEKVRIAQEADYIFIRELQTSGWYEKVWQAGAILLPVRSVGVKDDERTYENTIALRAVTSTDAMTAGFAHIPYELLAKISSEIIHQVQGVNRVVYDISSKPPATIEWE